MQWCAMSDGLSIAVSLMVDLVQLLYHLTVEVLKRSLTNLMSAQEDVLSVGLPKRIPAAKSFAALFLQHK